MLRQSHSALIVTAVFVIGRTCFRSLFVFFVCVCWCVLLFSALNKYAMKVHRAALFPLFMVEESREVSSSPSAAPSRDEAAGGLRVGDRVQLTDVAKCLPREVALRCDGALPLWLQGTDGWTAAGVTLKANEKGNVLAVGVPAPPPPTHDSNSPPGAALSAPGAGELCIVALDNNRGWVVTPQSCVAIAVGVGMSVNVRPIVNPIFDSWHKGAAAAFPEFAPRQQEERDVGGVPSTGDEGCVAMASELIALASTSGGSLLGVTKMSRKHPLYDAQFVWLVKLLGSPLRYALLHGAEMREVQQPRSRGLLADSAPANGKGTARKISVISGGQGAPPDPSLSSASGAAGATVASGLRTGDDGAPSAAQPSSFPLSNLEAAAPLAPKGFRFPYRSVGFGSEAFRRTIDHPRLRGDPDALRETLQQLVREGELTMIAPPLSDAHVKPVVKHKDYGRNF